MKARSRATLGAVLTAGLLVAWSAPAYAVDTIDFDDPNSPDFTDDGGEGGTLTVTASTTSITFTNSTAGDNIDSEDDDCAGDGTTSVTCTPANVGETIFDFWSADMDDGDDTVIANGALGGGVSGGDGVDLISGSNENSSGEFLEGGDGNDQINSRNVGPRFPAGTFDSAGADGVADPTAPVSDFVTGNEDSDVLVTGNGYDFVGGEFGLLSLSSKSRWSGDGIPLSEAGADQISTGPGNDFASGDFGNGDNVNLGEGDDFVDTFAQDGTGDIYEGGAGIDGISFDSTSQSFTPMGGTGKPFDDFNINLASGAANHTNNTPESDTATNFEDAFTDAGNDTVVGNDSSNVLQTGFGNDTVNPGNGADAVVLDPESFFLFGARGGDGTTPTPAAGNDVADIADGFGDRLTCGGGSDTVQADQFDVDPNQDGNRLDSGVSADCEAITVVEKRAGGADVIAPNCTLSSVKKSYGRNAFLKGFNVRVTCSEGATLIVRLLASYSKKLFPAKAGDVVLAEKTATVAAGTAGTVKVKPLKKFRKRLRKKAFRVRVNVEARDQYGNRSVEQKSVKVKKARSKKKKK